jgi:myosin heavy subunit
VLLLCRPVLEAFGNSATAHNHNSSRFCKFISIGMVGGQFDAVSISTYLLERSRIVHHDPSTEQNFQIFYWLLRAGWPEETELLPAEFGRGPPLSAAPAGPAASPPQSVAAREPRHFAYLGGSRAAAETTEETAAAAVKMEELRGALAAIGVPAEEQPGLFKLVAAVLQLGNISFLGDASGGGSRVQDDGPLRLAAQGLGVEPGLLAKYLTKRPVVDRSASQRSRDSLDSADEDDAGMLLKLLSPVEAARCRDSLAKAVYGHLFQWLVRRMNAALAAVRPPRQGSAGDAAEAAAESIGLLDIFGFESFAVNSFEQLCINYANERLQQLFVATVFTRERAIHMAEGVSFPWIVLPDADAAIRAIAARPAGVLWLLDSSTRQLGARETAFFIAVNEQARRTHGNEEARVLPLPKRLRVEEAFLISHFAGDVTYTAGGSGSPTWLDKNNSSLVPELHRAMLGSTSPLVQQLFAEGGFGMSRRGSSVAELTDSPSFTRGVYEGSNRGSFGSTLGSTSNRASQGHLRPSGTKRLEVESVSREFIQDLDGLMAVLRASRLHFVRTVKPNRQMAAAAFSPRMVVRQLRCAGTNEAVRVMKLAYLSRVPYGQLFELLGSALPAGFHPAKVDRDHFVRCLLPRLGVPDRAFALGHSRVFLKASAGPLLEAALDRLKAGGADSEAGKMLTAVAAEAAGRWAAATAIAATERAKSDRRQFAAKRRAAQRVQRHVQRQMFASRAREIAVEMLASEAVEGVQERHEKDAASQAALREGQEDERTDLFAAKSKASTKNAPVPAPPEPRTSEIALPPSPPSRVGMHTRTASHVSAAAPAVAPMPYGFPPSAALHPFPAPAALPPPSKSARSLSRKRLGSQVQVVPDNKPAALPEGWPPDLTSEQVDKLAKPQWQNDSSRHSVPTREPSWAWSNSTRGA